MLRTTVRLSLDHPFGVALLFTVAALAAALALGAVGCSDPRGSESLASRAHREDAGAPDGGRHGDRDRDGHGRGHHCGGDMSAPGDQADMGVPPDMGEAQLRLLERLATCGNGNVTCALGWGCDYGNDCVPLCLGHELDGCDVDLASGECALMCFTQGCRDLGGTCPDGVGLRRGVDSYRTRPSPRQQSIGQQSNSR